MVIYYRFAGLVASIALMANLLLTVGFMVAVQATFTLSGLAGIVLTLGMAVDANVLIYERLREERERGASLLQAIRNGYDRALPTIIDTHLSSIFTAIVLYVVGNDQPQGLRHQHDGRPDHQPLHLALHDSRHVRFLATKGWLTKLTMIRLFAKPEHRFHEHPLHHVRRHARPGDRWASPCSSAASQRPQHRLRRRHRIRRQADPGVTIAQTARTGETTRTQKKHSHRRQGAREIRRPRGPPLRPDIPDGTDRANDLVGQPYRGRHRQRTRNDVQSGPNTARTLGRADAHRHRRSRDQGGIDEARAEISSSAPRKRSPNWCRPCSISLLPRERQAAAEESLRGRTGQTRCNGDHPAHLLRDATEAAKKEPNATASPSFVKSLLNRELRRRTSASTRTTIAPNVFEFERRGHNDTDGKYKEMKFTIPRNDQVTQDGQRREKSKRPCNETARRSPPGPYPTGWRISTAPGAARPAIRAMWAILASWGAILLYLWFRFGNWTFGLAAVICLIHDLFFTLGAIAVCHYIHDTVLGNLLMLQDFKIDLPSVAALLTLVGYSVNDTIVVFDRIREVRGKNPDLTPKMINDSINQTLSRTMLSSLTVWLVVIVLYSGRRPGRAPVRLRDGRRRHRRNVQLDLHRQPAAADVRRRQTRGDHPGRHEAYAAKRDGVI